MSPIIIKKEDLKLFSDFLDRVESYTNKAAIDIVQVEKKPLKEFFKIGIALLSYGEEHGPDDKKYSYRQLKDKIVSLERDNELASDHPFIAQNLPFKELVDIYTVRTTEEKLNRLLNKKISEMTGRDLIDFLKHIGVEILKNN